MSKYCTRAVRTSLYNAVRMPYKYCTSAVSLLYKDCQRTVQGLYVRTSLYNAVRMSYKYCTSAVSLLYKDCQRTVQESERLYCTCTVGFGHVIVVRSPRYQLGKSVSISAVAHSGRLQLLLVGLVILICGVLSICSAPALCT